MLGRYIRHCIDCIAGRPVPENNARSQNAFFLIVFIAKVRYEYRFVGSYVRGINIV